MNAGQRAKRLNKRAASHSALDIADLLDIQKGEVILDIGAGGGLLTFEFSKLTGPDGLVIAADIDKDLLGHIDHEQKRLGIENVKTMNVKDRKQLQRYSYDLIFMRNVFHHLQNRVEFFSELRSCLTINGRIVIIDWNERANIFMRISGHYTLEQSILDTMKASGFTCQANYQHLKVQSFIVFCSTTV